MMAINRRSLLRYSGLGVAAYVTLPFVTACSDTYDTPENPEFWKAGNYPPVTEELTEEALIVEGEIPADLDGLYVRNGPNAWSGATEHFFMGDGMLHGLRFTAGKASWYRNRYVQTPLLYQEPGPLLGPPGLAENQSNVSLIHHGGRLLSLGEAGWAYEIDPSDLSTRGVMSYQDKLQTAMTAHPKIDPDTGVMHFFGYGVFEPYLTYHQADAQGNLVKSLPLKSNGPAMMHDFAMTENHVIFMELPVLFSMFKAVTMDPFPFGWDEDAVCRMGVLRKNGSAEELRWFDVPRCFIFHTMNAFERGSEIVLDAARYDQLWVKGSGDFNHPARLSRYSMNLDTGSVSVEQVHEQAMEFPQVNRQLWGRDYRYGYALSSGTVDDHVAYDGSIGLMKFDMQSGRAQHLRMPKGVSPGEPMYVAARQSSAEDHGYLLSYVYLDRSNTSEMWVLDATNIEAGPVARIALPGRVPVGFHGLWVPSEFV